MPESSHPPHHPDRTGSPSPLETLIRGDWRSDPQGLRDPVGWLADRSGTDPEYVRTQLEFEARQLDRPQDRADADRAAAALAAHRAIAPDGLDGDRARAILDATIAAMYAGYSEHLARAFVRRRLTRTGEDAGIYHGAALEGLMDAVREYHPADGSLTAYARGRIERALRSEYAGQHSAERIGDVTAARGLDLSGFHARLNDRPGPHDRARRRAARDAGETIAGMIDDPRASLSDSEKGLLRAFLNGGASNLTRAAAQAGITPQRASQLAPRIARRLLRAAPELEGDLADAGLSPSGRGRGARG
jgi:hypothetical protein